jgi:hypothetical protein
METTKAPWRDACVHHKQDEMLIELPLMPWECMQAHQPLSQPPDMRPLHWLQSRRR